MSQRKHRIPLQSINPTTENRIVNTSDKYRYQIINLHTNGHIDNINKFEIWLNNQNTENIEPVLQLLKNGFMKFANGKISMRRSKELDRLDGGNLCKFNVKFSKK